MIQVQLLRGVKVQVKAPSGKSYVFKAGEESTVAVPVDEDYLVANADKLGLEVKEVEEKEVEVKETVKKEVGKKKSRKTTKK